MLLQIRTSFRLVVFFATFRDDRARCRAKPSTANHNYLLRFIQVQKKSWEWTHGILVQSGPPSSSSEKLPGSPSVAPFTSIALLRGASSSSSMCEQEKSAMGANLSQSKKEVVTWMQKKHFAAEYYRLVLIA